MTRETMQRLMNTANEIGITMRKRDDYSGRGMFGDTTHAVIFYNHGDLLAVAARAAVAAYDEGGHAGYQASLDLARELRSLRFDSLGREKVAY